MRTKRFEDWCKIASTRERCAAAAELAFALDRGAEDEREQAQELLFLLARDPSPHVRETIARALAASHVAPRALVVLLLDDIDRVASPLATFSPVLRTAELIELASVGTPAVRLALARRKPLCRRLFAALAEVGEPEVCREILFNAEADASPSCLRGLADRAGGDARLAELLAARPDLPGDVRERLSHGLGSRLLANPLVRHALGGGAERIVSEAGENAILTIVGRIPVRDLGDFCGHLRRGGRLSTAFLVLAASRGELDLLAASLAELSRTPYARVRRIIVDARTGPFAALSRSACVPDAASGLLLAIVRIWKEAVAAGLDPKDRNVVERVMESLLQTLADTHTDPSVEALLARTARRAVRPASFSRAPEILRAA